MAEIQESTRTTVTKFLDRGRSPEWIHDAMAIPVDVIREIAESSGRGTSGPPAPRHAPPQPAPARATSQTVHTVLPVQPHGGRLELLLARAVKHETALVKKARERALDAVGRLETTVAAAEDLAARRQKVAADRAAAKARVEALEKQLREARAALRPKRRPEPAPAVAPKEVRAWARANGVECPASGRVPRTVVEAYLAAK